MSDDYILAIDQGTTSTRFMVFDHAGDEVARHQLEHEQILPRPGWVEQLVSISFTRVSLLCTTLLVASPIV